jgi:hypothetical protein
VLALPAHPFHQQLQCLPPQQPRHGGVDVVDLLIFVDSFGAVCGTDRAYDPRCDFNADSGVDVVDLLILVDNWPQ